jgi:hypothetical protein
MRRRRRRRRRRRQSGNGGGGGEIGMEGRMSCAIWREYDTGAGMRIGNGLALEGGRRRMNLRETWCTERGIKRCRYELRERR